MLPAADNAAMPSPRHVEYASIEFLTCWRQRRSNESAAIAESATPRVVATGALVSVSSDIDPIDSCPCCCAPASGASAAPAITRAINVPLARGPEQVRFLERTVSPQGASDSC